MRIAAIVVFGFAILLGGFFWVNRPQIVPIIAPLPADFPDKGFSHQAFERLLGKFVDERGRVDYDEWHGSLVSLIELDTYLAAISAYSPDNAPSRFPSKQDELAYWMYGYNAYVIHCVLDHWPIASVRDVKAPLEAVRGLGFFYRLRYLFGGEPYSLYAVENEIIRKQYRDARVHFVLNCASESCPVIRPELPTGEELESLLAQAAIDFVGDPANTSVDHDNQVVHLSSIFDWYEKDFVNELRAKGRTAENGVLDYIAMVASDELRADLSRAKQYTIRFRDFDWRINADKHAN